MRKAVIPSDSRITTENISVIPRYSCKSTGWPPAVDPPNIVQAVAKAVGQPPIPTKAFRSSGVHGWLIAFEHRPTVLKFALEINGITHEILLVEEPAGPIPKPIGRSSQPANKLKKSETAASKAAVKPTEVRIMPGPPAPEYLTFGRCPP